MSALARGCYLGRDHWKEKYARQTVEFRDRMAELEATCEQVKAERKQFQVLAQQASERIELLEQQLADTSRKSFQLPEDHPADGQHYGASLMALSVNLARTVGLRKSTAAMKVFFDWLDVKQDIPTYQSIRMWICRLGLARMQQPRPADDWIWLVDQSNQIGQDKCLTVLGIRQSNLPAEGEALKYEDMVVLAMIPAKQWNRSTVLAVYKDLSNQFGMPRAVITDGAVELREPVEMLENKGQKPAALRDMKHFLANCLEKLLNNDPHYTTFLKEMGQTRSAMQQTELSHLAPPVMRQKARFMNLEPVLKWASMALWHFDHPESESRKMVPQKRVREKLSWLTKYRADIPRWNLFQSVMSRTLTFINRNGVRHGTARRLRGELASLSTDSTREFINQIIAFVQQHEKVLKRGERLPMSTEILESSFGKFKALEQGHAKSGFTQLLLAFPCLLKSTTSSEITEVFGTIKVKDVKEWAQRYLPSTHDSRRQVAYREYRKAQPPPKNKKRATPLLAAA